MIKKSAFEYEGRSLEVRAAALDNEFKVRVFEGDRPVTKAVYSVAIETAFDAKMSGFPLELVDALMSLAEQDVLDGKVGVLPAG
jgi:hypothetical protein